MLNQSVSLSFRVKFLSLFNQYLSVLDTEVLVLPPSVLVSVLGSEVLVQPVLVPVLQPAARLSVL